jgi:hypothetical protein
MRGADEIVSPRQLTPAGFTLEREAISLFFTNDEGIDHLFLEKKRPQVIGSEAGLILTLENPGLTGLAWLPVLVVLAPGVGSAPHAEDEHDGQRNRQQARDTCHLISPSCW